MRIAAYNVENLFARARALKLPWDKGREILERHARINELLNKPAYGEEDKEEVLGLLELLGLSRRDDAGKYAQLRQVRGKLLKRPTFEYTMAIMGLYHFVRRALSYGVPWDEELARLAQMQGHPEGHSR